MVLIQLKDLEYFDDDFEYDPFLVEEDKDFEKKYKKLVHLCQTYDDFNEIEEFIDDNFKRINFETRIINI